MRTSIAIATFFCVWFITLFAVLPFFARDQEQAGDIVPGTPESAPHKINVLKIVGINTLVAIAAFGVVYGVVASL